MRIDIATKHVELRNGEHDDAADDIDGDECEGGLPWILFTPANEAVPEF